MTLSRNFLTPHGCKYWQLFGTNEDDFQPDNGFLYCLEGALISARIVLQTSLPLGAPKSEFYHLFPTIKMLPFVDSYYIY